MKPIARRSLLGGLAGAFALNTLPRSLAGPALPLSQSLDARTRRLLVSWGEALLRHQVNDGSFRCPACTLIHGRVADTTYPLLALAKLTGDVRYRDAALRAVAWSHNVDAPDGAWTNELDPKSWKGITVFTALSMAHALERHGDLLTAAQRDAWLARLRRAGAFIHKTFNFDYGNINYPVTATYGLLLLGRLLNEPAWQARARELAHGALAYLSPNHLLFGEGHPMNLTSPSGCRAVDLGYNVEESLPSLLAYARLAGDAEVERAVRTAYRAHLEFMLPDGAWDNSWGTRSFKWTYWGSRTSDGAYAALLTLAREDSVFYTAAERHLGLLERCTVDGHLYGGPHLRQRGAPPCIHHTLTHIKSLVEALHEGIPAAPVLPLALPRESAKGVSEFPEIGTWLVARGPWRATITRYDVFYRPSVWHPTGGALSMLHHAACGPVIAGSLADYVRPEEHNMQLSPDAEDFALTPRIELMRDGTKLSTLYCASAKLRAVETASACIVDADTSLCNAKGDAVQTGAHLRYKFDTTSVTITASSPLAARVDVPIIADATERVRRIDPSTIEIAKHGATLRITASAPIELRDNGTTRVFNLVPGFLAVPVSVPLTPDVPVTLRVETKI